MTQANSIQMETWKQEKYFRKIGKTLAVGD